MRFTSIRMIVSLFRRRCFKAEVFIRFAGNLRQDHIG